MKVEIKIPKMGESIVEATIGTLLKPSGSLVKADEEILEIETEKVNQVLTAPAAGKLELTVKTGDTVKVDQVVGSIDTAAAGSSAPQPVPQAPQAPKSEPISIPKPIASSAPPVRKTADEYLSEIGQPSIPKAPPPPAAAPPRVSGRETRKKMSKLRRVIAARLVQVKNETAMLTTFNEVDLSAVMKLREENQENFQKKHGVKLGFMSFFVKACGPAKQRVTFHDTVWILLPSSSVFS